MKYLFLVLLLAGCAGQSVKEVHDVQVSEKAVAVKCVDQIPVKSKDIKTVKSILALDDYHAQYAWALTISWYEQYTARLEAALAGCK